MKRLPRVPTEMALHVLAYNLTRVINIMGIQPLMAAMGQRHTRVAPG
jgi:transposase